VKLSLQWKWFLGLTGLLVVLVLVVDVSLDLTLPPYLVQRIRNDLQRDAILARAAYANAPAGKTNAFAHELARQTGLRVTIIAPDGRVIGESDRPPEQLTQIENHSHRPEIQAALSSKLGSATRHSDTIGVDLMYVAAAMDDRTIVRVALPLHEIDLTTTRVRRTVGIASLIVIVLALPVVFWLSRRLTEPIDGMRLMATRVAAGDFSLRAPESGGPELQELGSSLNEMSRQLETKLRELTTEKADLNATLSSMSEGVLVVDGTGKIRLANQTLRRRFQLGDEVIGKTALEVFRNVGLAELIAQTGTKEVAFLQPDESVFAVTAATLSGATGAVAVFHDITRIKQLENIRKEFVANVSHELRTPLSIIKGYVETLLDGQPPDAATSRQFLETIQRHTRRLEALIDDLLSISELESQQARLNLAPVSLRTVAGGVVDEFGQRARDKKLIIELPDLQVRADADRLRQVFLNLLDNAIKYTQAGCQIRISARPVNGDVEVCVADNGPGIAPEHLPRIFERFYRVDKARSRELGGTGLGLAIVKHIVQAHGGRVWAESELEKGSRFYFTLPQA
jgi:two-component system, OmpR family, phosphate regulon sensor histidine kinase PhoR